MSPFPVASSPETTPPVLGSKKFWLRPKACIGKLISGSKNIKFADAIAVAESFGFRLDRVSGSRHILVHPGIPELINLQNVRGKAKPYQVKQLIKIVEKYNLHVEDHCCPNVN
jgi:hypothetical protein